MGLSGLMVTHSHRDLPPKCAFSLYIHVLYSEGAQSLMKSSLPGSIKSGCEFKGNLKSDYLVIFFSDMI